MPVIPVMPVMPIRYARAHFDRSRFYNDYAIFHQWTTSTPPRSGTSTFLPSHYTLSTIAGADQTCPTARMQIRYGRMDTRPQRGE